MYRIHIVIRPDPDEGGFLVSSPMFPELHTEGDTYEEAVRNAEDAAKTVVALYEALGKPMPAESIVQPAPDQSIDMDVFAVSA